MYFNGGGFIGYHVFNVVKLVSVFGYGLITLLILVSSMILYLTKNIEIYQNHYLKMYKVKKIKNG